MSEDKLRYNFSEMSKQEIETFVKKRTSKEVAEVIDFIVQKKLQSEEKFNKISLCDVSIESNTDTLSSVESTINRLIKKNSKFITLRNNKMKADLLGYLG